MATEVSLVTGQKSGSTATLYFEPDYPSDAVPLSECATTGTASAVKYAKSVGVKDGVGGTIRRYRASYAARNASAPCTFGVYSVNGARKAVYCTDFLLEGSSSTWKNDSGHTDFFAAPNNNYNFYCFEYADGTRVDTGSLVDGANRYVTDKDSSTFGGRKYGKIRMGSSVMEDNSVLAVFSHIVCLRFVDADGTAYLICTATSSSSSNEARPMYVVADAPLSSVTAGTSDERTFNGRKNYLPQVGAVAQDGSVLLGYDLKSSADGSVLARVGAATTMSEIDGYLDSSSAAFNRSASGGVDTVLGYYRNAYLVGVWGTPHGIAVSASGAGNEVTVPSVSADVASAQEGDTVTLTAQTDGLATCQFSAWTVNGATVGTSGVVTFTMPASDVTAVAVYTPKKFSVSVSHDANGDATVLCRATPDASWDPIPQGGVEYGRQLKFSATPGDGYVFDGWYKSGDEYPYSVLQEFVVESVSEDISLEAQFIYGSTPQKATLTVISSDNDKGTVNIEGGTDPAAESDGSRASAKFDVGDDVTLIAVFDPEFVFDGWYADGVKISDEPTHKFKFGSDSQHSLTEYRAEFGVSDDAIYEWEGSTYNKQMEWRSKVYVAPKPFDPVAARVDATSYAPEPVSLNVGTMSSPDAEPTRDHAITIGSQDGRRLPRMRPERFVRFEVKSRHEIDAVVIGTNMAEVN